VASDGAGPPPPHHPRRRELYTRLVSQTPSPGSLASILTLLVLASAAVVWLPSGFPEPFLVGALLVFALPAVLSLGLTPFLASAAGGRIAPRRSAVLTVMVTGLGLVLLALWRLVALVPGIGPVPILGLVLLTQGPALWFRHLTLFGVSRPNHLRSLPASLVQPVATILGVFAIGGVTIPLLVEAIAFLLLGFGSVALLLAAADRPLQREFAVSGVSLIRPLLDHVNHRDPSATSKLEAFFRRFAIPADLRVGLLTFQYDGHARATVALPTVHPGPFAALGASDLPRKVEAALGPEAGTVFVPHTPCNHALDLPGGDELGRVTAAARALRLRLGPGSRRAGPLRAPRAGALARAQPVGDAVLVVITQAPEPTDDIDFAVTDQLEREYRGRVPLAIVDAHNSYVEGQGDIIYGTPTAARVVEDARAAIDAVVAGPSANDLEIGTAARTGYSIGHDGIGPHGIRVLAIRSGGEVTAYVLIDGNNLVRGLRDRLREGLGGLVAAAEILTTDNHVVHEVDGGINPVGERYPFDRLLGDVRATVERAIADLGPATATFGSVDVPSVPVLGPGWTDRLLTSLGDTFSMFANAFLTTFLLLLAASAAVLLALR